jgi:hypothetical protein
VQVKLFCGRNEKRSGLDLGKPNPVTVPTAPLVTGKEYVLDVVVNQDGDPVVIDSTLDGKPLVKWQGKPSDLPPASRWDQFPLHCPGIDVYYARYVFKSVCLTVLSGKARILRQVNALGERAPSP